MGGKFAVLYPQEAVLEVFEMTHFDRFIFYRTSQGFNTLTLSI
jgi:hypothetical protein